MSYEPVPEDELVEQERMLMPAGRDIEATARLLSRLPDVAAYVFLLNADPEHPVGAVIRDKWSQLDHRSGPRIALVVFEPPAKWAAATVDRWRQRLGDDFPSAWEDWQASYGLEPGAAYDYLGYFATEPPLRPADLPCLVIFCDPAERRAVVRSLPDWPADDLQGFLENVIDTIVDHADDPASQRLDLLAADLTSIGARARTRLGHLLRGVLDYVKTHPATVVTTVVSAVIALGTANVLPLSVAAIAALKEVKGDLKGGAA